MAQTGRSVSLAPISRLISGIPRVLHNSVDGLRLQTLIYLRWLAVTGQLLAVVFVYFWLGYPLPLVWCIAVIAASAWLNIFLSVRWPANLRLRDKYAALLLAYDISQLAGLLYLTGGLSNPFSFLFLVPVTVSAATLPLKRTLMLGALTLVLVTALLFFHLPLPWEPGHRLVFPPVYIAGMWSSILCGLAFAAIYAYRVSSESRDMSGALAATEFVLAQEQRLSALDGLAAAAAHELGTPLATIALVASELKREMPDAGAISEDLDLLSSQAQRCREILATLGNRDAQLEAMQTRLKLTVLLHEICEPLASHKTVIEIDAEAEEPGSREPVVTRHPGIRYGLTNLLENAVDFAKSKVLIEARWSDDEVVIFIIDDGPGFAQDIIGLLGEPYVSTRKGYARAQLSKAPEGSHQGMGLGFFIAKTLLTRSGANVVLANLAAPGSGATIRISWPREALETGSDKWSF